jgi:hypothetical protein
MWMGGLRRVSEGGGDAWQLDERVLVAVRYKLRAAPKIHDR